MDVDLGQWEGWTLGLNILDNDDVSGFVAGASISFNGEKLHSVKNGTIYSIKLLPGISKLQLELHSETELEYR